ncbi:MAG TPA: diacylglycerol kinase family protein [Ohtaekwangia sp.]|uniref:diacylglycerol/lipid kinase family protein n=1 Tax=Ohtaekwangia sp. TaxID=2066019 RepID=UPI002F935CD7
MKPLRLAVILNGISLEKRFFYHKILPALRSAYTTEVFETRTRHDAFTLASKAVDKSFDVIIAAGGDGTLHQVINGVLQGREQHQNLPVTGVIPVGTGNDFARTIQVTSDPAQLMELLRTFEPKAIDVGEVIYTTEHAATAQCYFINVADLGMGPEVVKRVLNSGRPFGSAVAYYSAILQTFITYSPMVVTAKADEWEWQGKLRSMALGNGKYYGHGLCIAPDAIMNDNLLDAFICGNVSVLDFIRHSMPLKQGKHIRIPEVWYKKTKAITLTSPHNCLIEADGELLGKLPATIRLASLKLRFLMP